MGEDDSLRRIFVAVALPEEIKAKLSDLMVRLRKGVEFTGAHPAWVRPEGVHITLAFLGGQSESRVQEVIAATDAAARGGESFVLRLSGLHLFPTPKNPRVIALGAEGELEKLGRAQDRLKAELKSREFSIEERPFRAHLTLARIKSMKGLVGLRDLLAGHQKHTPGKFTVEKLTVYESQLAAGGSIYQVVHEAVLSN